jgi:hypothetical protein
MLPVYFSLSLIVLYLYSPKILSFFKQKENQDLEKSSLVLQPAHIWFTTLLALIIFLIIECLIPFYFVQDDNMIQFLPRTLFGIRMMLEGSLPLFDNYRRFGVQLLEEGVYSFFNPLMIFSFLACKIILGNIYYTFDFYIILCLLIGTIFMGFSLSILRVHPLIGIAAMLSNTFLGFTLITCRGWYFASGFGCYLPVLIFFFLKAAYTGKTSWVWFIGLGFLRGIYANGGHLQFFVYGAILEAICYVYAAFKLKNGKSIFLNYLCSILFSLGIALPTVIPQFMWAKDLPTRPIEPMIARDGAPFDALISSFLPYPFSQSPHPMGWVGANPFLMTNLFHIGFLWVFSFFIALIIYMRTGKGKFIPFLVLTIITLLMTGGTVSLIYCLKYYIPSFNKLRFAFKIYPYASFLVIIYGALILTHLKKLLISLKLFSLNNLLNRLTVINIIISIAIAIFGSNTAYYTYGEKPYPPLDPQFISSLQKDDIIYSITPFRKDDEPYFKFLPHDVSTLFDLHTYDNYATIYEIPKYKSVNEIADPISYFKDIGITKIIVQKLNGSTSWEPATYKLNGLQNIYEDQDAIIYATDAPKWQIREVRNDSSNSDTRIEYTVLKSPNSIFKAKIVSTEKTSWEYHRQYRPGFYLLVNNQKAELTQSPNYSWCMFDLPPGENEITIDYAPPSFWSSVQAGFLLIILSFIFYYIITSRNKLHQKNEF